MCICLGSVTSWRTTRQRTPSPRSLSLACSCYSLTLFFLLILFFYGLAYLLSQPLTNFSYFFIPLLLTLIHLLLLLTYSFFINHALNSFWGLAYSIYQTPTSFSFFFIPSFHSYLLTLITHLLTLTRSFSFFFLLRHFIREVLTSLSYFFLPLFLSLTHYYSLITHSLTSLLLHSPLCLRLAYSLHLPLYSYLLLPYSF